MFSKLAALYIIIFSSFFSMRAFAQSSCWQNEIDPVTAKVFSSDASYNEQVYEWQQSEPELPWLWQLYQGWQVAKAASQRTMNLPNDKQMHCFVGCRISQEVSLETAVYAGWRKELKDLTDCNLESHFEFEDYRATVHGGRYGVNSQGENLCFTSCAGEY